MKQVSVLIVDDEPDILMLLRTGLQADGFRTALAGDGETALARVQDHDPDVILLDLMMPMVDGWTVLDALSGRRRPALVVVSARARESDMARAYRLGADAYVTKPFSFDELAATIRDVVHRSPRQRERHRRDTLRQLEATAGTLEA